MQISQNNWNAYVKKLAKISTTAAEKMTKWLDLNGGIEAVSYESLIHYAYILQNRYGAAAATLAAEMYDEIAAASGKAVAAALPAETATYRECAKTIGGALKESPLSVAPAVGRLVKQAGADTMLQNASRDGAEFAWIPDGGSCPFCLMLASRGWQKARKIDHAEHIHSNCRCEFAIRFNPRDTVEGYNPDKYLRIYNNADGHNWREKLNSIAREQYDEETAARKHAEYMRRKEDDNSAQ